MHRRLRRLIDGCLGGEPESSPRLRKLFRRIDKDYRRADEDRVALQRALSLLSGLQGRREPVVERRAAVSPKSRGLSRLFDQAPFATVLCDADRKVVAWNAAAEQLFGVPRGEAVGRDLLMLAFPDTDRDRADDRTELRRLLDAGEPRSVSRDTPGREAPSRECDWSIVPLRDRKGDDAGLAVLIQERAPADEHAELPGAAMGTLDGAEDAPVEAELRGALARDELRAEYSPIVGLASGEVEAFEAALRWEHPRRGDVPPAAFLPVADETGLIVPLGRWLLGAAAREVGATQTAGASLALHVDLTANQLLDADLLDDVERLLVANDLAPRLLVAELAESTVQHGATAAERIADLRRLGVRVSLDHFGSGECALGSLYRFPLDAVKIDSSLFAEEAPRTELVRAIVSLARDAGMAVLADGIETPGQLELVRELGCDAAQGPCFPARQSASLPQNRMRGYV